MTAQTLLDDILPKLGSSPPSGLSFFTMVNGITNLIVKRLWYHESDLVTKRGTVTINLDADNGTLPTDFLGLKGKPFVSGYLDPLEPLDESRAIYDGEKGIPEKYEVMGTTLYVYPAASTATTLKLEYFFRPADLTALTDNIPFNDLFNDVYREAVPRLNEQGFVLLSDPVFEKFVYDMVESLLPMRSKPLPSNRKVQWF